MTREQAINYLFSCGFTNEQVGEVVRALTYAPTTKNDLPHCQYTDEEIAKSFIEDVEAVKDQLPTTKNNLGVDCISRKAALDITWHDPSYSDPLNVLTEIRDKIRELPSVTPQEPRKGEWLRMSDLSEQEDNRYKCSRCGNVVHHKNKMDLYTFNSWCGRCGSDNGRYINYEVEE